MLHPINRELDSIISNGLKDDIVEIENENQYYMRILFADRTHAKLWNENKYYAWAQQGSLFYDNGEVRERYSWERSRLSRYTQFKLYRAIQKYNIRNNKS